MTSPELAIIDSQARDANVNLFVTTDSAEDEGVPMEALLGGSEFSRENSDLLDANGDAFCGTGLWPAYYKQLCLDSIGDRKYDFYIFTRVEFEYATDHIELNLLHPRQPATGWVPDGEDYGGLGDRHFVTSDYGAVAAHMGHWSHVAKGDALRLFRATRHAIQRWQMHEYLLARLGQLGVTVDRIPAFGFLVCVEGEKSVSGRLKTETDRNSWEQCATNHGNFWRNYSCVNHRVGVMSRAKYVEEILQAVVVASCLNGARWTAETVEKCFCQRRRLDSFYGNIFQSRSDQEQTTSHGEGMSAGCPMGFGSQQKFLNPRNMMPDISQEPAAAQTEALSRSRETSSIPKTGSAANWEYPSSQMFFNALLRREKTAEAESMDAVVYVHNFVNEETWKQVLQYETLHASTCKTPSLQRFIGRSEELSPKARVKQLWLGRPFDRHDWFVDRCGQRTVRYVIDYYDAPSQDGLDVQIDVRPALDDLSSLWDRFRKWIVF